VKPLSLNLFPLSFEGEGDKGGEVSKHSQIMVLTNKKRIFIITLLDLTNILTHNGKTKDVEEI